jgi:hypothetical protein
VSVVSRALPGWLAERADRRFAGARPAPPITYTRRERRRRTRPGRWLGRHRVVRLVANVLAALTFTLLGLMAFPGTASAVPGIGGCTNAPTPEAPGQGIAGFFMNKPNPAPAPEDPFAQGAKSTPFQQYGLAGLDWYTYDLGCGGAARDPSGAISAWAARIMFIPAKAGVAALTAVSQAALQPTFLSTLDSYVQGVTDGLNKVIFTPLAPLAVMLTGLLLMSRSTRQRVGESATAIGWCVLVMLLAFGLFSWPVQAGHAVDKVVTSGVSIVSQGLRNGDEPPAQNVSNALYGPFMYRMWLMGEFCDPDSNGATQHGSQILRAQAFNWAEAERARTVPGDGELLVKAKNEQFDKAAAAVKKDDPSAYECLAGHGSSSLEAAMLADVGVLLMAPFLLAGGLLLIGSFIVVRLAVMLAPALLTAALFFPLRDIVSVIARIVAAAVINAVFFTLAMLLVIRIDTGLLAGAEAIPSWLRLVLVGLVTYVMWGITRPLRRLRTMMTMSDMAGMLGDENYDRRRWNQVLGGNLRGRRAALSGGDPGIADDVPALGAGVPRPEARSPGPAITAGGRAALAGGAIAVGATRVASSRLDGGGRALGGDSSPELPGGGGPDVVYAGSGRRLRLPGGGGGYGAAAALPAGSGGSPPSGGGAGGSPPMRGRSAPPGARRGVSGRHAGGGLADTGGRDAVPAGVHQPPMGPRARRVAERMAHTASRPADDGLFNASAPHRLAPEDDNQGYRQWVQVGVFDGVEVEESYYVPSRDRPRSGRR